MAGSLQKAFIYNEDTHQQVLECLFNPTDYTFSKANTWDTKELKKKNVPKANFTGGGEMIMKFQLFFDTYLLANSSSGDGAGAAPPPQDVRDYTGPLLQLMKLPDDKKTDRPPIISFGWGDYWGFKGVIKSINLKFTLFTPEGKPVRATADLELLQVEDDSLKYAIKRQNPTSGGDGPQVRHTVQLGETLDLIAYQEYGDATKWRLLADANNIEDPRAMRPGQRLVVPPQ